MHSLVKLLKKMFGHETDHKVDAIVNPVSKQILSTAETAKVQRDLLRKNGVTMQIYIATGGDKRHG